MALKATIETNFGETREIYVRINNVEVSNHGAPANALFRGFLSREAFLAGKSFVFEKELQFTPNLSAPLWEQAYVAAKKDDPLFANATDA